MKIRYMGTAALERIPAIFCNCDNCKKALAAVGGSASQVSGLLVGFFNGIASGATVIIAQLFGGRQQIQAQHLVKISDQRQLGGIIALGLQHIVQSGDGNGGIQVAVEGGGKLFFQQFTDPEQQ